MDFSLRITLSVILFVMHTEGLKIPHKPEEMLSTSTFQLTPMHCIAQNNQCTSVVLHHDTCMCIASEIDNNILLSKSLDSGQRKIYLKIEEIDNFYIIQRRYKIIRNNDFITTAKPLFEYTFFTKASSNMVSVRPTTLVSKGSRNDGKLSTKGQDVKATGNDPPVTPRRDETVSFSIQDVTTFTTTQIPTTLGHKSEIDRTLSPADGTLSSTIFTTDQIPIALGHKSETDRTLSVAPTHKPWKDECHGQHCCQCGRVVEDIMDQNNQTSALYLMRGRGEWTRFFILSVTTKKVVPLALKFSRFKTILSAHMVTSMCMGVFAFEAGMISACLDGGEKTPIKKERNIFCLTYDKKSNLILFSVMENGMYTVWKSVDITGKKVRKLVSVKMGVCGCFIEEIEHLLYWYNNQNNNLYQYNHQKGGAKPKVFNRKPLPFLVHVLVASGGNKMAICFQNKIFIFKDLHTGKIAQKNAICTQMCYANNVWFAIGNSINIVRTPIFIYSVANGRFQKKISATFKKEKMNKHNKKLKYLKNVDMECLAG